MSSHASVKQFVERLLPNKEYRRLYLSMLTEVIKEADSYGSQKWGVYYEGSVIRFLLGQLILFTIHENSIWISLDKELLNKGGNRQQFDNSKQWQWDTGEFAEYKLVPSINGYYAPEGQGMFWSQIKPFHFRYIEKVAKKYPRLNVRSQRKYTPELLYYISMELEQEVPRPSYGHLSENPILDVEEFKVVHSQLSETERESLVQSRIGQGQFRENLINYWQGCAVTGCRDVEVLRASHIKPWRSATNSERIDTYNGLLLIPNLDSAFDRGLISFRADGNIIMSGALDRDTRNKRLLMLLMKL